MSADDDQAEIGSQDSRAGWQPGAVGLHRSRTYQSVTREVAELA